MSRAEELLAELALAGQAGDKNQVRQIKDKILAMNDAEGVKAHYRLGLYVLTKEKNLDEALAILKDTAASGIDCPDTVNAQISYALCLWAKDKKQQSVFELRKVLSGQTEPSPNAAIALDYLALFLRDSKADKSAIATVDEERIRQLTQLANAATDTDEHAQLVVRLAAALEDRNQPGDLDKARVLYQEVAKSKASKIIQSAAADSSKRLNQKSK